jgi:hypothetical protein
VKTSSTHKIESDQSDDDMEYSLFDDVKGKWARYIHYVSAVVSHSYLD